MDSAEECVEEFAFGVEKEDAIKYVKAVWQEADRQCRMRRHATVEKFFDGTLKSEASAADTDKQVFQPKNRSRPELPNIPKRPKVDARELAATRSSHENALYMKALKNLWDIFTSFGTHAERSKEYMALPSRLQKEARQYFFEHHGEAALPTLTGIASAFRRWRQWVELDEQDSRKKMAFMPTEMHVTLWLHSLRARGPTVPRSAYNSLKWLQVNFGASFHVEVPSVKDAAKEPSLHEPVQATPLSVKVWLFLEAALTHRNPFVTWLAATWFLIINGVLRFIHVQRSHIYKLTDVGIFGHCSLGKSKRGGRRRPFRWVAVRHTPHGTDLGAIFQSMVGSVPQDGDNPKWLLSDFGPSRVPLKEVNTVMGRAMSLGRFHSFSHQFWMHAPLSLENSEARCITSYSARRNLPSLAQGARFTIDERIYVGGWLDAEAVALQKRASQPDRYSEMKLEMSLNLKHELVITVGMAIKAFLERGSITHQTTWEEIMQFFPSRREAQQAMKEVIDPKEPSCLNEVEKKGFVDDNGDITKPENSEKESLSEGRSKTNSSSSASSSLAEDAEDIPWLMSYSQNRRGYMHLQDISADTPWTCMCGRKLKKPIAGVGLHTAKLEGAQWSPRCFERLTKEQKNLFV